MVRRRKRIRLSVAHLMAFISLGRDSILPDPFFYCFDRGQQLYRSEETVSADDGYEAVAG